MGDIHRVLLEIDGVPLVSVGLVTDTLRETFIQMIQDVGYM